MERRHKLTKGAEKAITRDWQAELPTLGIHRPRWLLRRAGPLVLGVCLDRDSSGEVYKPVFHVHCLGRNAPTACLTLATQLRSERAGGPDFVEVRWHEQRYREAAARMARQALLPLSGDLTLGQTLGAYRRYMATPLGERQAGLLYWDMICLVLWSGDRAQAVRLHDEWRGAAVDTPSRPPGEPEGLRAEFERLIEDPARVREVVASQIGAHGLGRLPASGFLCEGLGGQR